MRFLFKHWKTFRKSFLTSLGSPSLCNSEIGFQFDAHSVENGVIWENIWNPFLCRGGHHFARRNVYFVIKRNSTWNILIHIVSLLECFNVWYLIRTSHEVDLFQGRNPGGIGLEFQNSNGVRSLAWQQLKATAHITGATTKSSVCNFYIKRPILF